MKNIPQLNEYSVSKENVEEFRGLDHNERTQTGEWYDMENMSCDDYPVASTRSKRNIVPINEKSEYDINGQKLSVDSTILDACENNGSLVLLKNASLHRDDIDISGKVLSDVNGDLINISKKNYKLSNCQYSNLWWEFEKNYMFFSENEILCTLSGRKYKRSNSEGYVICAYVTTTESSDGPWTYPLIISKTNNINSYWSDDNKTWFLNESAIEYTDDKGQTWWYKANSAAMPGPVESTLGRAKNLGTFDTPENAVKALVDIYYSHFGDYNNFWGYSPLFEYPCNRNSDVMAWNSIFKGIDADKSNPDSQVYHSYILYNIVGPESCIVNFASYFYEDGIFYKGYNLSQFENSIDYENALKEKAKNIFDKIKEPYEKTYAFEGEYYWGLCGYILIYDKKSFKFKVLKMRYIFDNIGIEEADINGFGNVFKNCFYVNGPSPKIFEKNISTPIVSDWVLTEDNFLSLSGNYKIYDICTPVTGSISENVPDGNITVKNSDVSNTNVFGLNKSIETALITGNENLLLTKNINPKFIYDGQNARGHTETLQFTLQNGGYDIDEITNTIGLFGKNIKKRSMISNGTNLLVIPDGVIIYTKNNSTKKVEINENYSVDMHIKGNNLITFAGNSNDASRVSIGFIGNEDGWYRVVDNQIQQSILSNGSYMWVNIASYVMFSVNNPNIDFTSVFKVGDVVEISFNITGDINRARFKNGLLEYSEGDNKFKTKTVKISRVETNYIDFENTFIAYPTVFDESGNATRWTMGFFNGDELSETDVNITITKKFPSAELGCESQNRVWLAQTEGHEIYASALGDPTNFYDYAGLTTDSYAANVGTSGKFTGVVNYLGTPLFFKENAVHILGGSMPSEYYITTITDFKGCEEGSENSFAIINNILYYKSPFGIVAYDGSGTTVISEALGRDVYKNGIAGALGNKYYISLYNTEKMKRELFCYDTTKGLWTKENDEIAIKFISLKRGLVYVTSNQLLEITSDFTSSEIKEDNFNWFAETGIYGYSYPNKKYISRFQIRMYLAAGSMANFYIQYNSNGIWHPCGAQIVGKGIQSFLFPIRPQRCDHMKLRIEGRGQAKIYSITKLLEEGGDI